MVEKQEVLGKEVHCVLVLTFETETLPRSFEMFSNRQI